MPPSNLKSKVKFNYNCCLFRFAAQEGGDLEELKIPESAEKGEGLGSKTRDDKLMMSLGKSTTYDEQSSTP